MKVLPISMFPTVEESKSLAKKENRRFSDAKQTLSGPLSLLIWANKAATFHSTYGLSKEQLADQALNKNG